MKWQGRRQSQNIEDRRGQLSSRGRTGNRLLGFLPMLLRGRLGKFGFVLAAGIVILQFVDVGSFLPSVSQQQVASNSSSSFKSGLDGPADEFVAVVLAETEQTWKNLLSQEGRSYPEPKLVLYREQVASACGNYSSAVGPFYCPADQKIYLDLSFLDTLRSRLDAPGDFAAAYVVAHEVGHHIQNVLGINREVASSSKGLSQVEKNRLSVAQELQADCFSGLWANRSSSGLIEDGDISEGLRAAAAIGDDTLQKNAGRAVRPETFTHGSSAERMYWFKRGYEKGTLAACDPFNRASLSH